MALLARAYFELLGDPIRTVACARAVRAEVTGCGDESTCRPRSAERRGRWRESKSQVEASLQLTAIAAVPARAEVLGAMELRES